MKTYYVKQKISLNDNYYVYDTNDKQYLKIVSSNRLLTIIDRLLGSIFTLGNKLYVRYPDGEELLTIKKKFGFFKEEFDLCTREDTIASIKQHIVSIKPKISIITDNNKYLVEGDLMARNFTISKDNMAIAKVNKTIFNFKDSYKIDIFEEKDELICLSLLIVIDNLMHN